MNDDLRFKEKICNSEILSETKKDDLIMVFDG